MSEPVGSLPYFAKSPVVEVAVGVEFLQLPGLGAVQLVALHDLWREEFPKIQEQPALPPTVPMGVQAGFQFQIGAPLPGLRLWMLNDAEDELLQVQNDRLFLNWRKAVESDRQYPRYDHLRAIYQRVFSIFQQRIERLDVGTFRPHTATVTYVNRFALEPGESLRDAFAPLNPAWDALPDAAPEVRLTVPLWIDDPPRTGGQTTAVAALDATDRSYGYLEVVSRINVAHPVVNPFDGLDVAHEACVTGFETLTTPKMHERWGKQ